MKEVDEMLRAITRTQLARHGKTEALITELQRHILRQHAIGDDAHIVFVSKSEPPNYPLRCSCARVFENLDGVKVCKCGKTTKFETTILEPYDPDL